MFDLDGTLLPLDQDAFTADYLKLLAGRMAHLVEARRFIGQLWAATAAMVSDVRPGYTNKQILDAHLCAGLGLDENRLTPIFADFYAHDFRKLKRIAYPSAAARKAVKAVLSQGRKAVVATNPLFPMTAIQQRMAWAGIADLPFSLVTSYETSHYCKPQLAYYREILALIGCRPGECLMVGNDVEEDLVAAKLGIKTYLVTDWMINRKNLPPSADYCGSLTQLAVFLAATDLASL